MRSFVILNEHLINENDGSTWSQDSAEGIIWNLKSIQAPSKLEVFMNDAYKWRDGYVFCVYIAKDILVDHTAARLQLSRQLWSECNDDCPGLRRFSFSVLFPPSITVWRCELLSSSFTSGGRWRLMLLQQSQREPERGRDMLDVASCPHLHVFFQTSCQSAGIRELTQSPFEV